jgi:threonine dehydratase
MTNVLPTVADVIDADSRLRGWVVETPVLESEAINARVGARVLFKVECLQHTGSFKIRGALNRLLQLSADERAAGVVAFSSGNHAQAVALAARWLKVHATIVMPADAPKVKVERTREHGAEVVPTTANARTVRPSRRIAERRGAALVPPFDHPHIIAGQGTRSSSRAQRGRGTRRSAFYARSGGGLVGGCAPHSKPSGRAAPYAVEPQDSRTSRPRSRPANGGRSPGATLCDGLRAPTTGAITFAILKRELAGALAVDDAQIRAAMALAAEHLKVLVEPSGAAALAAVLAEPRPVGTCIAVVLSGGNVDAELFADVLRAQ